MIQLFQKLSGKVINWIGKRYMPTFKLKLHAILHNLATK